MALQHIVIAVMGPPGSGKTNFINKLAGTREAAHQTRPYTQGIREIVVNLSDARKYVFVDFPAFDDTRRSDREILRMMAEWLEKQYRANIKLGGIIYTHRITDNWMSAPVCKNLVIFSRLCGDKAACGVRLVTTMWDKVTNRDLAESRVLQLENNCWRPLIEAGALHKRFEEDCSRCAWEIIRDLTGEGEALLLQEELVDADRKLNETSAGQALYKQFKKLLQQEKKVIKECKEEVKAQKDPERVKHLEREQGRLRAELDMTVEEMDKLQIPFSRRISLLFSKNTHPKSVITLDYVHGPGPWAATPLTENDYVIFVVGPTRAGKTWFTSQLLENHNGSQHHHTKNVKAWRCNLGNGSDDIIVVDAPSFHPDRNNFDAENGITGWLESKFTEKCHSAILFLHSLDSDPKGGDMSMSWHLEAFAKTFCTKFTVPSDICVVPTRHPISTLRSKSLSQRLLQLRNMTEGLNGNRERNWHASFFPGVFYGQPETAWSAALLLLKNIAQAQTREFFAPPRPALRRMPPQSSDSRLGLKDLADILLKEFKKKKRNRDPVAIVALAQIALEYTPPEHPQRRSALIDLANLLSERFNEKEKKENRQSTLKPDHYLSERTGRGDSMSDVEEIITYRRVALKSVPSLEQCRALLNLADALHQKFREEGTESSIAEAVRLARAALSIHPPGHPCHTLSLNHLADYLEAKVGMTVPLTDAGGPQAGPSSRSSSDIKDFIDKLVSEKVKGIPLRLLHTPTGFLCGRDAQISHFKGSPQYEQLLLLAPLLGNQQLKTEVDYVVSEYFEFVTLSHTWGRDEPLLCDVRGKSVYDLGGTDGETKLRKFCILALRRSFQWAWSDTCCIDKDSSAELQEAIGSMFSWYHWSSLTIVHLSDVSDAGSLVGSNWFTRGWTLQELLASHTVLFYTHSWSLYVKTNTMNHKTDPALLEELRDATGIAKQYLRNFSPGIDNARSRLHWASGRRTTRPEDIAYSLFGIFQVHLPILYGESTQNALGRLLAEIISRSGDVSVLDWVGESSSFNSCFPVDLAPYQTVPHFQLIPSDPSRHSDLYVEKALKLRDELARLPRAGFGNGKLSLPCTVHPLTAVKLQGSSIRPLRYIYEIHASRMRVLNVALSVELDERVDSYILVRPWHPKSLQHQINYSDEGAWKLLELLEQPFNALLLKKTFSNEYTRIACDCMITARVQDLASTLDSEVLILEIV